MSDRVFDHKTTDKVRNDFMNWNGGYTAQEEVDLDVRTRYAAACGKGLGLSVPEVLDILDAWEQELNDH